MNIYGLRKTTLLDYPGRVACTLFTRGCNFRCPFCQNRLLVLPEEATGELHTQDEIMEFLYKRAGVLQGVCITGGEPTLQPDLAEFIRQVKSTGLAVKLDTNGYEPEVLRSLLDEGLVDYIAMDIKNSPGKYASTVGLEAIDIGRIKASAQLIMQSGVEYEFRTTVTRELHEESDFNEIAAWLAGARRYFLQGYVDSEGVIDRRYTAYDIDTINAFAQVLKGTMETVEVRGIE